MLCTSSSCVRNGDRFLTASVIDSWQPSTLYHRFLATISTLSSVLGFHQYPVINFWLPSTICHLCMATINTLSPMLGYHQHSCDRFLAASVCPAIFCDIFCLCLLQGEFYSIRHHRCKLTQTYCTSCFLTDAVCRSTRPSCRLQMRTRLVSHVLWTTESAGGRGRPMY